MSKAINNLRDKRDEAAKQVEILNLAIAQLEDQQKAKQAGPSKPRALPPIARADIGS
jgi:outer membrane murein-binding lipoprotein Lpp